MAAADGSANNPGNADMQPAGRMCGDSPAGCRIIQRAEAVWCGAGIGVGETRKTELWWVVGGGEAAVVGRGFGDLGRRIPQKKRRQLGSA